jgi:hypothetical protein
MSSTTIGFLILAVGLGVCLKFRESWLNATGRAAKTGVTRLGRIKKASWFIVVLLAVCLPLSVHQFLGFLFGWNRFLSPDICRAVILDHVYDSSSTMPSDVFWLWVVQQCINWFGGIMLLRLFWLYGKGIIFAEKNITCIRVQGYCLIINCFIDLEMQRSVHASSVSLNPIIYGLMIIFMAWIMDEGRKIQEEQELTV